MSEGASAVMRHGMLRDEIASRVLALYFQKGGTMDEVLRDLPFKLPPGMSLPRDLPSLSPLIVTRLCNRAVRYLAVQENQQIGRAAVRVSDWRVVLYSLTSAPTLRSAILRCTECFEAIDWRCGRMGLRVSARRAELRLDPGPGSETVYSPLVTLYGIAAIHDLLSSVIGRAIPVEQVALGIRGGPSDDIDLPPLPFRLDTDSDWSGFVFPASYLDHPVVSSVNDLAERGPQNLLFYPGSGAAAAEPAADIVRRLTRRALAERHRVPTFAELVRYIGGSAATLRRRLAAEGLSFRHIKESCRREIGLDLLRSTDMSIEEIAIRLDFCDSDAFRRAFRDWLNMSPSQYRHDVTRSRLSAGAGEPHEPSFAVSV